MKIEAIPLTNLLGMADGRVIASAAPINGPFNALIR